MNERGDFSIALEGIHPIVSVVFKDVILVGVLVCSKLITGTAYKEFQAQASRWGW